MAVSSSRPLPSFGGDESLYFSWNLETPRASRTSAGHLKMKTNTSTSEVISTESPKPTKPKTSAIKA